MMQSLKPLLLAIRHFVNRAFISPDNSTVQNSSQPLYFSPNAYPPLQARRLRKKNDPNATNCNPYNLLKRIMLNLIITGQYIPLMLLDQQIIIKITIDIFDKITLHNLVNIPISLLVTSHSQQKSCLRNAFRLSSIQFKSSKAFLKAALLFDQAALLLPPHAFSNSFNFCFASSLRFLGT